MKRYLVTLVLMVMCWHTGLGAMDFWDPSGVDPLIEREKPQESLESLKEYYQIMAILTSNIQNFEDKTEKAIEKKRQEEFEKKCRFQELANKSANQPKSIWTQLEESARRRQWGTLYSDPTKAQQQREAERARSLQESIERCNQMQARLALYTHDFAEEAEKLIARRRREEAERKCESPQLMTPSEVFNKIQIAARKLVKEQRQKEEREVAEAALYRQQAEQQLRQEKAERKLQRLRNQSCKAIKGIELSKQADKQAAKDQQKKYKNQRSNNYAVKNKKYLK